MGPPPQIAAVRQAVRRCLDDLPRSTLVLVAGSGGGDSNALAAAVAFEAPRLGLRAGFVTVDHGLQPRSAGHARDIATRFAHGGFDPVEVIHVRVLGPGGPEAAARTARYAALDAAASRHRAAAVLLGHTRDDQAETVLLGLARGSGARSLAGMAPMWGRYRRPLLDLRREDVRRAAELAGLPSWEDPHNLDSRFARVRVRSRVLPMLEAELGPGVTDALARTARLLRDDADALDEWAARAARECTAEDGSYDVRALAGLPAAIRRRLLRRAALAAGAPATDLFAVHIDGMEQLVIAWHGQRWIDLPGGRRARRQGDRLLIDCNPGSSA